MKIKKYTCQFLFTALILTSCKEKFEPPVTQVNLDYLVVDGFLNNGPDTTFIRLSRTRQITAGTRNSAEPNAQLSIEDVNGNTLYSFQELNPDGTYVLPGMNLDVNNKYRLRINTANGKQYLSDDIPVIQTPPIDSISWEKSDKGVTISANTHDAKNNTRYYRWEYTETYQYHAQYFSLYYYKDGGLNYRLPQDYIYECWRTNQSKDILLATSANLSQDIIYHNPIRQIDQNSVELSTKYFIFLKQYALSKDAFEYMENLRKLTEQTGSIFDAQPSEMSGNIHAVNNPGETVLGFLTASTAESKDIYITTDEVQPWHYSMACSLVKADPDQIELYFGKQGLIPLYTEGAGPSLKILGSDKVCADCRLLGGTTTKPVFWP